MNTNIRDQFYKNLASIAEKIMTKKALLISGKKFEILSLSIHCRNDQVSDAFVTSREKTNQLGWFVSPREYSRYIDIDLTSKKMEGGFRIDAVRSIDGNVNFLSCGKVYDVIKSSLKRIPIKDLNGESVLENKYLSLVSTNQALNYTFYKVPRLSGYHFNIPSCELPDMRDRFLPLKIVKTLKIDSIFETTNNLILKKEIMPLLLNLYFKHGQHDIAKHLSVKKNVWLKYVDLYEKAKNKTQWEILENYQDCNKSNQSLIAELAGHFSQGS